MPHIGDLPKISGPRIIFAALTLPRHLFLAASEIKISSPPPINMDMSVYKGDSDMEAGKIG